MADLWHEILCADVPLAFHNGLIDLTFIYQHFYAELPEKLDEFLTNISDWFHLQEGDSKGFYDSKFVANAEEDFAVSYLGYFDYALATSILKDTIDVVDCKLPDCFYQSVIQQNTVSDETARLVCEHYAKYGCCCDTCRLIHNVDVVLDLEEQKRAKVSISTFLLYRIIVQQNFVPPSVSNSLPKVITLSKKPEFSCRNVIELLAAGNFRDLVF
ncbi:unnamed protein product [Gongylonema pulchrum]|uniref:Uncharacterized protein n=1 Tax=Gongylonema pulchrum TaxID=637853 RepID=A0A3P7PZJ2_9BILA|nr:unnamed protein product [Gongylonema pulchrum]